MGKVYIYALMEPDTGDIRYIGATHDTRARLRNHLDEARRHSEGYTNPIAVASHWGRKAGWLFGLHLQQKMVILRVLEETDEESSAAVERKWIHAALTEGFDLFNEELEPHRVAYVMPPKEKKQKRRA